MAYQPDHNHHRLTRRQFAAALTAAFLPAQAMAAPKAPRIAALDWGWAESLLAMELPPFAVAEAPLYGDRVVVPALPDVTVDLGLRSWPNMELLRALKPDLILSQAGYGASPARLDEIARTLAMPLYSAERQPLKAAETGIRTIAGHIGRERIAADYLQRSYARLDAIALKVKNYDGRPLLIVKFADERLVDIYGAGGLFDDVLKHIGIENAWGGPTNKWGFATAGLEVIARYPDARVIIIEPGPPGTLLQSALWQSLPAVQKGHVAMLTPTWVFGAFPSAMRFAEVIQQSIGIA